MLSSRLPTALLTAFFALSSLFAYEVALAAAPFEQTAPASSPVVESEAQSRAESLLEKAQAYYDDLEYDKVPRLAEEVLAIEGAEIETRLEAYRLQAQALAVIGDPVEAESPFRLLLRARPDFDLPEDTPPRILAVFRKVQAEEKTIIEQVEALRRKRIIEQLSIVGDLPSRARGGHPILFSFRLRDPTGAVEAVNVPYRRQSQANWSVLALERDEEGSWRGAITGEWTASSDGFTLSFFIETRDASGPLLTLGDMVNPKVLEVAAGLVERERMRPIPRWAWRSGAVSSGALAVLGGGFAYFAALAQSDYANYLAQGSVHPIDGVTLQQKADRGRFLVTGMNVALISAGVMTVTTLVVTPLVEKPGSP